MNLKSVSGILVTRGHKEGRVEIDLARNDIVDGDLEPSDLQREVTIAPHPPEDPVDMRLSYFDEIPSHTVGLREVYQHGSIHDHTVGPDTLHLIQDRFQINSTINKQRLTISWKGSGGAEVEEITYLAIGPVSSPPPGPR